jgi:hypothetical protein
MTVEGLAWGGRDAAVGDAGLGKVCNGRPARAETEDKGCTYILRGDDWLWRRGRGGHGRGDEDGREGNDDGLELHIG